MVQPALVQDPPTISTSMPDDSLPNGIHSSSPDGPPTTEPPVVVAPPEPIDLLATEAPTLESIPSTSSSSTFVPSSPTSDNGSSPMLSAAPSETESSTTSQFVIVQSADTVDKNEETDQTATARASSTLSPREGDLEEDLEVVGRAAAIRASLLEDKSAPASAAQCKAAGISIVTSTPGTSSSVLLDASLENQDGPIFSSPTETDNAAPQSAKPAAVELEDTVEESRSEPKKRNVVECHTDSGSEESDAGTPPPRRDTLKGSSAAPSKPAPTPVSDELELESLSLEPPPLPPSEEAYRRGHQRHVSREGGRVLPVRKPSGRPPRAQYERSRSRSPRPPSRPLPPRVPLGLAARYEGFQQAPPSDAPPTATFASFVHQQEERQRESSVPDGIPTRAKLSPADLVKQLRETLATDPTFYYTLKGVLVDHDERRRDRRPEHAIPQYVPPKAFERPLSPQRYESLSDDEDSELEDYEFERMAAKNARRDLRKARSPAPEPETRPPSLQPPKVTEIHTDSEVGSRSPSPAPPKIPQKKATPPLPPKTTNERPRHVPLMNGPIPIQVTRATADFDAAEELEQIARSTVPAQTKAPRRHSPSPQGHRARRTSPAPKAGGRRGEDVAPQRQFYEEPPRHSIYDEPPRQKRSSAAREKSPLRKPVRDSGGKLSDTPYGKSRPKHPDFDYYQGIYDERGPPPARDNGTKPPRDPRRPGSEDYYKFGPFQPRSESLDAAQATGLQDQVEFLEKQLRKQQSSNTKASAPPASNKKSSQVPQYYSSSSAKKAYGYGRTSVSTSRMQKNAASIMKKNAGKAEKAAVKFSDNEQRYARDYGRVKGNVKIPAGWPRT